MDLITAFRVNDGDCIAFVGAGGKTSAMFTLARQLADKPVIVTTTTHISFDQAHWGDRCWFISDITEFELIKDKLSNGVNVIVRELKEEGRVGGPEKAVLEKICEFAHLHQITFLIEADGSKMMPIKAPADYEPEIPAWANTVVVCTGLSGIGTPLDDGHVHRPEIFSKITGLATGSEIRFVDISNELTSPNGGLKNIPSNAKKIALLNQADTAVLLAKTQQISRDLLTCYDSVVVSKRKGIKNKGFSTLEAVSVKEKCAGIILAAGGSARFGLTKQLLDWHGKPFIWHIAKSALLAELNPIYVVIGSDGEKVANALADLPVKIISNSKWTEGQSTSIRAGINSLPERAGSAIFLLSDQPQIDVTLLQGLNELHSSTLAPIIAPLIDGKRGNPVLFDKVTFDELKNLQGDTGGRGIFSKFPITWLPWSDGRMLLDVDTPDDYEKLLRMD